MLDKRDKEHQEAISKLQEGICEIKERLSGLEAKLEEIESLYNDRFLDEPPDEWWDGTKPPSEEELKQAMTPEEIKSLPTTPAVVEIDSSGRHRPVVDPGWKLSLGSCGAGTAFHYLRAWSPHQEEVRLLLDPSDPKKYWIAYKPKPKPPETQTPKNPLDDSGAQA